MQKSTSSTLLAIRTLVGTLLGRIVAPAERGWWTTTDGPAQPRALFIGWGGTYPGREHHARKTFTELVEALTDFEAKGVIESFEPVVLTSNVGPLEGFVLIYGDLEKLAMIQQEDIFQQLRIKARLDNATLFVIPALAGGRVAEAMTLWEEFATEIEKELVTA
jgi:hypothetical protein